MCLIVGNWKLHGNRNMVITAFTTLAQQFSEIIYCDVAVAPPVMYLDAARDCLKNSCIKLCAQNVDIHVSGAFTGDISAEMLKDLNTHYVLIGHSDRRIHYKENNIYIAQKFSVLHEVNLTPILCIGENKEEYNSGLTHVVCIKQIDEIIKLLGVQVFKNSVIAYEPIWAIGSGISAEPRKVQKIHKFIRDYIAQYDKYIAKQVLIQYGGSVTSKNVTQFLDKNDIDGVLIGAASVDIDNFIEIIKIVGKYKK